MPNTCPQLFPSRRSYGAADKVRIHFIDPNINEYDIIFATKHNSLGTMDFISQTRMKFPDNSIGKDAQRRFMGTVSFDAGALVPSDYDGRIAYYNSWNCTRIDVEKFSVTGSLLKLSKAIYSTTDPVKVEFWDGNQEAGDRVLIVPMKYNSSSDLMQHAVRWLNTDNTKGQPADAKAVPHGQLTFEPPLQEGAYFAVLASSSV